MPRLIYHRLIQRDLNSALDHYEGEEMVWMAVLRHDRRHPSFGLQRKPPC